jgi:hypothetical protein
MVSQLITVMVFLLGMNSQRRKEESTARVSSFCPDLSISSRRQPKRWKNLSKLSQRRGFVPPLESYKQITREPKLTFYIVL